MSTFDITPAATPARWATVQETGGRWGEAHRIVETRIRYSLRYCNPAPRTLGFQPSVQYIYIQRFNQMTQTMKNKEI